MNRKDQLRNIAEALDARQVYDDFLRQAEALGSEKTRIGVMGAPNSGKTCFANALLGTKLPISMLESHTGYRIAYDQLPGESAKNADGVKSVKVDSKWLGARNTEVIEPCQDAVDAADTPQAAARLLASADAWVFLINSQAPLSRNELQRIEQIDAFKLPVLVVMSRADLLSPDDYASVLDYVKANLSKYAGVAVLDLPCAVFSPDARQTIADGADALFARIDASRSRKAIEDWMLGHALGVLKAKCQAKIDDAAATASKVSDVADKKKGMLRDYDIQWLEVETALRRRGSDITAKLRAFLDTRSGDIERRLAHDVDMCADVKAFWEKDFNYRLEELLKMEIQAAAQMVNQELASAMRWMQETLLRRFKCKVALSSSIVGDSSPTQSQVGGIDVADTNKLKIITRIGTAATVVAAGVLFASAGIGGIVMAASMMSGLGAEMFTRKKANESKEAIKSHIPQIVGRTQLDIITDFDSKIQGAMEDIIAHLADYKKTWAEASSKQIDQEKNTAIYSLDNSKWEALMTQINTLSETK